MARGSNTAICDLQQLQEWEVIRLSPNRWKLGSNSKHESKGCGRLSLWGYTSWWRWQDTSEVQQRNILHPCQFTFNPGGSSATVCSVGQDSRDLWRWLIASLVALCTALSRSSVILPPYRFCTPEFTEKIQFYAWDVYKATFHKDMYHLRDWSQWLQMPRGPYAAHSNKKGLVLSHTHQLQVSVRPSLPQCFFNEQAFHTYFQNHGRNIHWSPKQQQQQQGDCASLKRSQLYDPWEVVALSALYHLVCQTG